MRLGVCIITIAVAGWTLFGQPAPAPNAAAKYFTDVEVIDQEGRGQRFYTDLLKGKVVVINAFFTSCHDSCPIMADRFAKIQVWLGDRLGRQVHLISLSVDSASDSPAQLKAFGERFSAQPGWFLIGGKKENVDFLLKKLGQFVPDKNNHLNLFLIGNDRTGLWKKAIGTASAAELIKIVESVLEDAPSSDGRTP